jgi:hypothetical protein
MVCHHFEVMKWCLDRKAYRERGSAIIGPEIGELWFMNPFGKFKMIHASVFSYYFQKKPQTRRRMSLLLCVFHINTILLPFARDR